MASPWWTVLLLQVPALPVVQAGNDLDDFSNNLVSDLGPLLSLFGDSMSTQFLSESTSWADYIIFAMGPIGIMTALISSIRVTGSPALRAFIGRAQEGGGQIEAELCTSTSRDVCELFNNGGITRVLGRPQILEVIKVPGKDLETFRGYLANINDQSEWKRIGPRDDQDHQFPPTPNISLNVAIQKIPLWGCFLIAGVSLLLQVGVMIFAAVATWKLDWIRTAENGSLQNGSLLSTETATILFIVGTIVMCGGLFSCAALIGQSTVEKMYRRKRRWDPKQVSEITWIQPGNQLVGDQTFDAFAFQEITSGQVGHYTSSRKSSMRRAHLMTWVAILATLAGYILQFIGLRGLSSYVAVAQLGLTVLMSFVRGSMRTRRLSNSDNRLSQAPDLIVGHELDWLAQQMASDDKPSPGSGYKSTNGIDALGGKMGELRSWQLTGRAEAKDGFLPFPYLSFTLKDLDLDKMSYIGKAFRHRTRLAQLTGHPSLHLRDPADFLDWRDEEIIPATRQKALQLTRALATAAHILLGGRNVQSIVLKLEVSSGDQTETIQLPIKWLDKSSVKDVEVDSASIEAILGLWFWSILTRPELRERDDEGHLESMAANVPITRIVAIDEGEPGMFRIDLVLWKVDVSPLWNDTEEELERAMVKSKPPNFMQPVLCQASGGAADFYDDTDEPEQWRSIANEASKISEDNGNRSAPAARKIHALGWSRYHASGHGQTLAQSPPRSSDGNHIGSKDNGKAEARSETSDDALTTSSGPVSVQHLRIKPSEKALLNECAIELFSTAFTALANHKSTDIGRISLANASGLSDFHMRIQNTKITQLVNAFTENQIGSEFDAHACILSGLGPKLLQEYCDPTFLLFLWRTVNQRLDPEDIYLPTLLAWCSINNLRHETSSPQQMTSKVDFRDSIIVYFEYYRRIIATVEESLIPKALEEILGAFQSLWQHLERTQRQDQLECLKPIFGRYLYVARGISSEQDLSMDLYESEEVMHLIDLAKVDEDKSTSTNQPGVLSDRPPPATDIDAAIRQNDRAQALLLLAHERVPNNAGSKAVASAASRGWGEVAVGLVQRGEDPNGLYNGRTALSWLVENGNEFWFRALLDLGATPETGHLRAKSEDRDICQAVMHGRLELVKILIETGEITELDEPFHLSITSHASEEMLNYLLQQRPLNPGKRHAFLDKSSRSRKEVMDLLPAEIATILDYQDTVKVLLKDDRILRGMEAAWSSTLTLAIQHERVAIVKALLRTLKSRRKLRSIASELDWTSVDEQAIRKAVDAGQYELLEMVITTDLRPRGKLAIERLTATAGNDPKALDILKRGSAP